MVRPYSRTQKETAHLRNLSAACAGKQQAASSKQTIPTCKQRVTIDKQLVADDDKQHAASNNKC